MISVTIIPVKMTTTIRGSHRYTSLVGARSVVAPDGILTVVDDVVVVLLNVELPSSPLGEATVIEDNRTYTHILLLYILTDRGTYSET